MRIATGDLRSLCLAAILASVAVALLIPSAATAADATKVRISDASASESANALKFKVKLSGRAEAPVRVTYTTLSGSAIQGVDFKAAKGQLSFQPGKREKAIVVKLIPDLTPEGRETMSMKLSKPHGALISRARAVGTIKDDDAAQTLSASGVAPALSVPVPPPKVVIDEMLLDPQGSEGEYRYVELLNTSATAVDLGGWTIDTGAACSLSGVVGPGETFVVSNDPLILDNACPQALFSEGDTVTLRDGPEGTGAVVDVVDYSSFATATGESLSLDSSKADPSQNDLAGSWCTAKEAADGTYDPEGNYGSPGVVNGPCGQ